MSHGSGDQIDATQRERDSKKSLSVDFQKNRSIQTSVTQVHHYYYSRIKNSTGMESKAQTGNEMSSYTAELLFLDFEDV